MKRTAIFTAFVLAACFTGCSSEETVTTSNPPTVETNVPNAGVDPGTETAPPPVSETEGIQLRYRFEKGQRMDYIMSLEIDNHIVNLNQKTKMNMNFYFHVTVDVVEVDGSAMITQINDRFKFKVKGPGGTILYDSADGEESDHPQWQGLRQVFLPMQYAQCTYRVTTAGVVSDVKPTAELAERLEKNPSMAAVITQEQLEQNAFALFHPMPEGAVDSGATWNYTRNQTFGNFKFDFAYTKTFRGTEEHDGRQVVDITETVVGKRTGEVTPAFEFNFDYELTSGQEYFDPKLGWLVSLNDVAVTRTKQSAMGIAVESESSTKVSIQLQPAVDEQTPENSSE
ncbi:MAG TPA: hypothetical protein EYQ50_27510 [Verrucomicrobiales bacterium]|nr:hypothetical protein [Verrucomicrobiales bacterium]